MKFIADDGKIFDTMEECEEYERVNSKGREIATLWKKYVTTYNKHGEVTESIYTLDNDVSLYLVETSEILNTDEASYIHIECNSDYNWEDVRNYFWTEYGVILPKGKGLWRYDWDNRTWKNFNEEYAIFKNTWEPMGIHF